MSLNLVSEQLLSANGLNHQDLFAILGQLTERRLDYGDLYFQSSYHESWVLEDSIIKDGSYNIDQGVGVRAVSGEKTGFAYADQISKLALEQSAQTEREILPAGGEWSEAFGQTRLRVTAAERTDYGADEENDFSLATYLTYGETKFLFPGDAEDARQTELLHAGDIDCDVLKVPYHGRLVDASAAFLAACSPKIAFIPDSDEEAASPMVVAILKELGTDVHSGRDGDLVVVSDGKDVFVKHNN